MQFLLEGGAFIHLDVYSIIMFSFRSAAVHDIDKVNGTRYNKVLKIEKRKQFMEASESAVPEVQAVTSRSRASFLRKCKDKVSRILTLLRYFAPSQFGVVESNPSDNERYTFDILRWKFGDASVAKRFGIEYYLSAFVSRRIVHQVAVGIGTFLLILSTCGLNSKESRLYPCLCLPPLILTLSASFFEGILRAKSPAGDIGKTGKVPGLITETISYLISIIDVVCSIVYIAIVTRSNTNVTLLATYPMRYYTQYDMRHPFAVQVLAFATVTIAQTVVSIFAVGLSSSDRGFAIFVSLTLTPAFIFMCYSTLRTEYAEFVPHEAAKAECKALKAITEQFLSLISALIPRDIAEGLLRSLVHGESVNFHKNTDDCTVMFLEVSLDPTAPSKMHEMARESTPQDGEESPPGEVQGDDLKDPSEGLSEEALRAMNTEADLIGCVSIAIRPIRMLCSSKGVRIVKITGTDWIIESERGDAGARACLDVAIGVASNKSILTAGMTIRAGICRGKAYSGILGYIHPRFDLLGDTVNTAARLMKAAAPGFACIASGSGLDGLGYESTFRLKGKGEVKASIVGLVDMRLSQSTEPEMTTIALASRISSVLAQEDSAFTESHQWYHPKGAKHQIGDSDNLDSSRSSCGSRASSGTCSPLATEGFRVLWPHDHVLYLADSFDRSGLYIITAIIIVVGSSLTPLSAWIRGRADLLMSPLCISLCVASPTIILSAAVLFKILMKRGRHVLAYLLYMILISIGISVTCFIAGSLVKEPVWFFYDSFLTTTLVLPKLVYIGVVSMIVLPTLIILLASSSFSECWTLAAMAGAGILFECTKMWYASTSSESAMDKRLRVAKLEKRTRATNEKCDEFYHNMVPRKYSQIIQDMMSNSIQSAYTGTIPAAAFRSFYRPRCSILMADVVGFTELCSKQNADEVVGRVDTLFTMIDMSLGKNFPHVCKLKTSGDAFLAVSNVLDDADDHQDAIMDFAISILSIMKNSSLGISIGKDNGFHLQLRIGICSGSATLGIFRYDGTIAYDCYGQMVSRVEHIQCLAPPGGIAFEKGMFDTARLNNSRLRIHSERARDYQEKESDLTIIQLPE